MTSSEYAFREMVDRLFQKQREGITGILHGAVGLAGESGEVLDMVKKSWVYGRPLDKDKMLAEMGDVLHYLTMLCILLDVTFDDVMRNNMIKLQKRYPDGYSDAAAIARADTQPG